MRKIIGIYKITSPSNKVYIGQSVNIYNRFYRYKSLKCKTQPHLYNSLLKYGVSNHKFEVIHECQANELNELEKYYIDLYSSFNNKNGLNLKDGGNAGGKCSEITRKKISDSHKGQKAWNKGIPMSSEQYEKVKNTMFKSGGVGLRNGAIISKKTRKKMSEIKKGVPLSERHKQKISESMKGKTASNKGYRKNRKCDIVGCERIHKGHGFCTIHLRLYKKIMKDSGRNNLPEPPKSKVLELVSELQKFTIIHNKSNLQRLL